MLIYIIRQLDKAGGHLMAIWSNYCLCFTTALGWTFSALKNLTRYCRTIIHEFMPTGPSAVGVLTCQKWTWGFNKEWWQMRRDWFFFTQSTDRRAGQPTTFLIWQPGIRNDESKIGSPNLFCRSFFTST